MVAEGHRLRHLQVRRTGHRRGGFLSASTRHSGTGGSARGCRRWCRAARADVGRHLVVARTAGVQALAGVADERGQALLDVEMHVFEIELPSNLPDSISPTPASCRVRCRRGPCAAMMPCFASILARQRAADVLAPHALVEIDRGRVAFDEVGHRLGEASGPGVLRGVVLARDEWEIGLKWPGNQAFRLDDDYKAKPASRRLPDFRNLGVMLRLLLGVNLLALAAALVQAPDLLTWPLLFVELGVWVQPLLLCSLLLLADCATCCGGLACRRSGVVLMLVAGQAALLPISGVSWASSMAPGRSCCARRCLRPSAAASCFLFRPAGRRPLAGTQRGPLQALTARIRPHFLFNSLNAVLSLIRAEPKRAEHALEELAELFRALMRDNRELVPLADEIALCRQYLDLEKLRLGDRLKVVWQIDDLPGELLVPPLMLQPLLENAVYHGVEPSETAGEIRIGFLRKGEELFVSLENPVIAGGSHQAGNRMALANIRERLALHYDLEARLEAREEEESTR